MIKAAIRSVLHGIVNRDRFNDSLLYRIYVKARFPAHAAREAGERQFYAGLLDGVSSQPIFDIGANAGSKAIIFSEHSSCVVGVEPMPTTFDRFRERFRGNANITAVLSACGEHPGSTRMYAFEGADAYNTLSGKRFDELVDCRVDALGDSKPSAVTIQVPVTTLDALIATYGCPHYIKIDVEGYELEVIKGLSRSVPLVSVECNLPSFEMETLEIIRRLAALAPVVQFNYVTTEPPQRFEASNWLSFEEMAAIVSDRRDYMEIYCRSQN